MTPSVSPADGSPAPIGSSNERGRYYPYRPELDVLRFCAFFMVFLSHVVPGDAKFFLDAHIPSNIANLIISMSAGGAFGLDLFFTLSSFLISTLLLREKAAYGTINTVSFYARRILRIWPLYYVFLLGIAPAVHYWIPEDHLPLKYIAAFSLLAGNWACVSWGYPHSVASPLWSISIEEQFYLLWPMVLRRLGDHLVAVSLALLAISCAARLYLSTHGAIHPQIWCNSFARLDPFACGALLAVYAQRNNIVVAPASKIILLCVAITLFTAVGHYEDFSGAKSVITYPVVSGACVALMIAALGTPMTLGTPLVDTFAYLGRISYGLYVFHSMFIAYLDVPNMHEPCIRALRTVLAFVFTLASAAASYHFLEKPFLRRKASLARFTSAPDFTGRALAPVNEAPPDWRRLRP